MVDWIVQNKSTAHLPAQWVGGRSLQEELDILISSRLGMTHQINGLLKEADLLARCRKDIDRLIQITQKKM